MFPVSSRKRSFRETAQEASEGLVNICTVTIAASSLQQWWGQSRCGHMYDHYVYIQWEKWQACTSPTGYSSRQAINGGNFIGAASHLSSCLSLKFSPTCGGMQAPVPRQSKWQGTTSAINIVEQANTVDPTAMVT